VDAANNTTQYAFDDAGNQILVTDPKGHITKQQYDARKRLTQTTYDDTTTTLYSYDGPGNLTSVTDQANNTVNYTYDYSNQLRSVIQTASPNPQNTTSYAYDPDGNLINLTDANSHTHAKRLRLPESVEPGNHAGRPAADADLRCRREPANADRLQRQNHHVHV
jgi:YD repeat-containing protein